MIIPLVSCHIMPFFFINHNIVDCMYNTEAFAEKILLIIKVHGIMVNVDNARLTADLLERCCAGGAIMRRKETSDSARRQDQNLRKIDLERKLIETKCLEENKLEMSQALLVTRLQVSKNQLEQVVSTTSTKGKDVEEEVKTLHIYRRDLIQEICDIDQNINQKAAAIEGNTQTNQCSKEEQADQEVLAGLKELSRHNLDKLHVEQKMLEDILESTKNYASTLLHYKSIYEQALRSSCELLRLEGSQKLS